MQDSKKGLFEPKGIGTIRAVLAAENQDWEIRKPETEVEIQRAVGWLCDDLFNFWETPDGLDLSQKIEESIKLKATAKALGGRVYMRFEQVRSRYSDARLDLERAKTKEDRVKALAFLVSVKSIPLQDAARIEGQAAVKEVLEKYLLADDRARRLSTIERELFDGMESGLPNGYKDLLRENSFKEPGLAREKLRERVFNYRTLATLADDCPALSEAELERGMEYQVRNVWPLFYQWLEIWAELWELRDCPSSYGGALPSPAPVNAPPTETKERSGEAAALARAIFEFIGDDQFGSKYKMTDLAWYYSSTNGRTEVPQSQLYGALRKAKVRTSSPAQVAKWRCRIEALPHPTWG